MRVPNGPVVLRRELILTCPAKSGSNWGVGSGLCADTMLILMTAGRIAASERRNEAPRIVFSPLALVHDVPVVLGLRPVSKGFYTNRGNY